MSQSIVLIPAYNPDQRLNSLCAALKDLGLPILVVNDGSHEHSRAIFQELEQLGVTVIHHARNMGKGRALKTGFNEILLHFERCESIVTADADGQHLPDDIAKVATASGGRRAFTLGVRQFNDGVPFRSRFGNQVSRYVYRLLIGLKLEDTQTGLRGIGIDHLKELLILPGERYEYETNALVHTKTGNIPIKQVPITTVYIDSNRSSHFDPIRDSMRIYFLLFRFTLSSASTSIVDYFIFALLFSVSNELAFSMVVARVVAGTYNFYVNKHLVFKSGASKSALQLTKYATAVLVFGFLAFALVHFLSAELGWHVLVAKIVAEGGLFLASFAVQRDYIFARKVEE